VRDELLSLEIQVIGLQVIGRLFFDSLAFRWRQPAFAENGLLGLPLRAVVSRFGSLRIGTNIGALEAQGSGQIRTAAARVLIQTSISPPSSVTFPTIAHPHFHDCRGRSALQIASYRRVADSKSAFRRVRTAATEPDSFCHDLLTDPFFAA
jgi:hypothetical protein